MSPRSRLSRDSIDRALGDARAQGYIERWQRHIEGGYIVYIRGWGPERFTIREAHAFTLGIGVVGEFRTPIPASEPGDSAMVRDMKAELAKGDEKK